MNTTGKFTINPLSKKSALISDEMQFIDDLKLSKEVGFEFPHYYSNKIITGFRAAIVECENVDVDYIDKIYKIKPNKIYSYNNKQHLIFYFRNSLNKYDYNRITKALAFIYEGKSIDYHFYPLNGVIEEYESEELNDNLSEVCTKLYFFQQHNLKYQKALSINEFDKYLEVEKINIKEVVEVLYNSDAMTLAGILEGLDERNNIHKDYGNPFALVHHYYSSIEKAKQFFKDNFKVGFKDIDSFDFNKSTNGVVIKGGENLFISEFGYFTLDPSGNTKRLTDFYVKVHSKIVGKDGKHFFIVSLINQTEGTETQKIIWENKTSASTFSDFIQSYGPYHYYGGAAAIKELHRQISSTKQMPEIQQVIGYGHHEEEGIIIFKNGVWDIKERLFTKKKDNSDDYYYNYDSKGYWVTDKGGNSLSQILSTGVPNLNIEGVADFQEVLDFMSELYADNSGNYLIFLAFGMMGYMTYGDKTKTFPLIFTRGVTGSGKSAFNELLQRVWGIKKAGTDFENSTLFTMTVTLSYLIKFPYFIAEYREAASQRLQKVGTLRSVFDKISQTKGRADQSVVKYDYVAVPVLDGEEMIEDGALRTRSLQLQLLKKHKIEGNFSKILREGGDILDKLMFTYLTRSNGEKYQDFLDEGYEFFKQQTSQNRIAQNVASIYAGCMAFNSDKEYEELYKIVLSEIVKFQEEDVQENSTSMQILKVISKFMETTYNGVYPLKDKVIISWNALEEYVNRYRVNTTLKLNSYKEHLITMGFDIEFIETGLNGGVVEGVIIPYKIIPKNLLVHGETYSAYKDWKNLSSNKDKNGI